MLKQVCSVTLEQTWLTCRKPRSLIWHEEAGFICVFIFWFSCIPAHLILQSSSQIVFQSELQPEWMRKSACLKMLILFGGGLLKTKDQCTAIQNLQHKRSKKEENDYVLGTATDASDIAIKWSPFQNQATIHSLLLLQIFFSSYYKCCNHKSLLYSAKHGIALDFFMLLVSAKHCYNLDHLRIFFLDPFIMDSIRKQWNVGGIISISIQVCTMPLANGIPPSPH